MDLTWYEWLGIGVAIAVGAWFAAPYFLGRWIGSSMKDD